MVSEMVTTLHALGVILQRQPATAKKKKARRSGPLAIFRDFWR
jgi:hypothetical protein